MMGDPQLAPPSPPPLTLRLPLPPGFRFRPSDEELVSYYLKNKREQKPQSASAQAVIEEFNLYDIDPSDLPDTAWFTCGGGDPPSRRWYCFARRDRARPRKRRARGGYWKCRGRGRTSAVRAKCGAVVGSKSTFSFYRRVRSRPPKRTDWVMNEFDLVDAADSDSEVVDSMQGDFVLCCVFQKSHSGEKKLNQHPRSSSEDNMPAATKNDVGSPCKAHSVSLNLGNGNVGSKEDSRGTIFAEEDELHRLLMQLTDEPDNAVVPLPITESLSQVNTSNELLGGADCADVRNELIDPMILEGDFIELADLNWPLLRHKH